MSGLERSFSIADLRDAARRALPRIIFDYVEGGVEDEEGLAINARQTSGLRLLPRYFGKMPPVDPSVELLGRRYAQPFGLAPTGLAGSVRPGGDIALAHAAAAAQLPFVLSTVSNATIEAAAAAAGDYAWMQIYGARDRAITFDMMRRADAAGMRTLVVTVDTPAPSKRERNLRNGFWPQRMPWATRLEALRHPRWIARYLTSGMTPAFESWRPYAPAGATKTVVAQTTGYQLGDRQTWADLSAIRDRWPHALVVKGVLHPEDAVTAVEAGAQGLIVSNHGGRVFDRSPASFAAFPAIRAAVGDRATLMLDSGIMRGADIVTAFCLGAAFTFVGRAPLYGLAVGGEAGVARTLSILAEEVGLALGQLGCPRPADLGDRFLFAPLQPRN